jgi:hypothetical protein
MPAPERLISQLERVIMLRADQTEPGRRAAYERLGQILTSSLRDKSNPSIVREAQKLLESTVLQVEYRVVSRQSGKRQPPNSATEADAIIDQLAFLRTSEDLEFGYGPRYEIVDGRLAAVRRLAPAEEAKRQEGIHNRLRISSKRLNRALGPARNQYPVMAEIALEYEELLSPKTGDLDITAVWSVGDALSSLSTSYRNQNAKATMSSPLEPDLHALLDHTVREHGAFIMGFSEARTLIERADQFAMNPDVLKQIEAPGAELLAELANNSDLVTPETIRFHRTALDTVNEVGWSTGRAGFSSYLIVRNAVSAIIRATIGSELSLVGIAAATSLLAESQGVSHREFLINGSSVLRAQSPNILGFFAHSREFLDYVTWALELLDRDEKIMAQKRGAALSPTV